MLGALSFLTLLASLTPMATYAQTPEDTQAEAPAGPRYLPAIRAELEALHLEPSCEVLDPLRARCSLMVQNAERTIAHELRILIDEGTDTAYFYGRLTVAHPEDPALPTVLRRLGELNWQQLTTKFEWNPVSGEIRLSALQHLDTNFDRRAFRVIVRLMVRQLPARAAELGDILSD